MSRLHPLPAPLIPAALALAALISCAPTRPTDSAQLQAQLRADQLIPLILIDEHGRDRRDFEGRPVAYLRWVHASRLPCLDRPALNSVPSDPTWSTPLSESLITTPEQGQAAVQRSLSRLKRATPTPPPSAKCPEQIPLLSRASAAANLRRAGLSPTEAEQLLTLETTALFTGLPSGVRFMVERGHQSNP